MKSLWTKVGVGVAAVAVGVWGVGGIAAPAWAVGADGGTLDPARYVEVPLTGEFGDEVNALVVARAVELAKGKGAGTLVLVIDSPGGAVADAQAIAGVLKGASGEVRIVTVIKRAISASVWVTSHSDRVFFLPGGTLGAAVAFSKDRSTGAAEVDAKMNSALAGLVASAAEARGQNGAAYRAMIVPEAALYCVATEGKTSLVAELPPAAKGTKIDGEDTVLTLTAVQAELGFAPTIPAADEASLAKALGVEKMTLAAPLKQGEQTVRAANAEIRKAKEAYDRAVEDVTKAIKEATDKAGRAAGMMKAAEEADPASVKLTYVQETGLLTAASQVKWKQQTDLAVSKWRQVRTYLGEAKRAQDASRAGAQRAQVARKKWYEVRKLAPPEKPLTPPEFTYNDQLDAWWTKADEKIGGLVANRERVRM